MYYEGFKMHKNMNIVESAKCLSYKTKKQVTVMSLNFCICKIGFL